MDHSFICPNCSGILNAEHKNYICSRCNSCFPIRHHIPNFCVNPDYYFNPIPKHDMQDILTRMENNGWKAGLIEILESISPKTKDAWLRNILFNGRTAWRFLLNIPSSARVLDYGSGWGSVSLNLSKMFKEVVAFDMTFERLQFLEKMAKENGVKNLTFICGGDTPILPFPTGSFDAVVLNGVLEWIPTNAKLPNITQESKILKGVKYFIHMMGKYNPQRIQQNVLKEVARILKPSGQVYIGIENRYGYKYFLGQPDNHSGLLYGSLLPRIAAHIYSLLKSHVPYRTYTYSYYEWRRLLSRTHIHNNRFLSMIPDYKDFNQICDLAPDGEIKIDLSAEKNRIKKKVFTSGFYKFITPSFGIIASKSSNNKPFINSLLEDLCSKIRDKDSTIIRSLCLRNLCITNKDVVILRTYYSKNKGFIIRLPLSEISTAQVSANSKAINVFHRNNRIPQSLKLLVPMSIVDNTYRGQPYFVEEMKSGANINNYMENQDIMNNITSEIFTFITALHNLSKNIVTVDEGFLEMHVDSIVKMVKEHITESQHYLVLCKVQEYLKKKLIGQKIPMVFTHGDCSMTNFLVSTENHKLSAVIDWDSSEVNGFPVLDIISLIESRYRNRLKVSSGRVLREIFFAQKINDIDVSHIHHYNETLTIQPSLFDVFVIIYWLKHIALQRCDYILLNKKWLQSNLYDMLDFFGENVI